MEQIYKIIIKGHLDPYWKEWLSGFKLTHLENNVTSLTGSLPDQAALYGLLKRIRDLNLALISVESEDTFELEKESKKLSKNKKGV